MIFQFYWFIWEDNFKCSTWNTIRNNKMTSEKTTPYLICKDHTVSNKYFELIYNYELDMLVTKPQPTTIELPSYYESDAYISHTDSKKSITDKLYQTVKKYALYKKLQLINSFETSGKNILDVGCGTGDFLLTCKKNGWNITGVEPNVKVKKIAVDKLNMKLFSDITQLNSKKFDVITLWHALEHVQNLTTHVENVKSLLKPNGVLIVAVPNFKSYDATFYRQFWAAYDVPRHLWHFSKQAIELLFLKQKMKVVKILPMKFDSFYVSLLSEKYKTGKTNYLKAFYIGLVSNFKALSSKEYSSLIYLIKNTKNSF